MADGALADGALADDVPADGVLADGVPADGPVICSPSTHMGHIISSIDHTPDSTTARTSVCTSSCHQQEATRKKMQQELDRYVASCTAAKQALAEVAPAAQFCSSAGVAVVCGTAWRGIGAALAWHSR